MSAKTFDRYVCTLSGVSAAALDDDEADLVSPDDDLDDLPVGWARVVIETRIENPDWHILAAARHGLVNESVEQMGESPPNRRLAEILVDAQLQGAVDSIPRFLTVREDAYVAADYLDHARIALGILEEEEEEVDEDDAAPESPVIPEQPVEPPAPMTVVDDTVTGETAAP